MRIAILDDYQNVALESADWSGLQKDCEIISFTDHLDDRDALAARLSDFEIVGIMRERTPFPRDLIEQLPKLQLLVTTGMRNAAIDLVAAREHGIVVAGTSSSGRSTLELTFGLMLALTRNIAAEDAAMRGGGWQSTIGGELKGKTLGVLGLGRIGIPVSEVARAFGMSVIAWSENLTAQRARECNVDYAGKEELLAAADIISIHLVLSDRTRGLIGADAFGAMKRSALLINTARGPICTSCAVPWSIRIAACLRTWSRSMRPPYRFRTVKDPTPGGQGRSRQGKMRIAGAVELSPEGEPRRIRLAPIGDFSARSLHAFVAGTSAPGARVITDGWSGYPGLPDHDHQPKVVGATPAHLVLIWIHRVFSNLKRWALGTFHGLRRAHLRRYLDEFVFRWNRRRHTATAFDTLLGIGTRLRPADYRDIVGQRV